MYILYIHILVTDKYKKYLFSLAILILLLVGLFFSLQLVKQSQDNRSSADQGNGTNVVVFMVDDLDSASFYQLVNNNKLPNIKRYLIDKGATFNNSFVTESVCCSSRATFLTGMYSHNTGVYNVAGAEGGEKNFHQYSNNLPIWMQSLGYHTGMIGKYMNLDINAHGSGIRPGWDYWRNIQGGYDSRPGMYSVITNDNSVIYPDYYQAKYIAKTVENFLNQYPKNFFLYITPHSPSHQPACLGCHLSSQFHLGNHQSFQPIPRFQRVQTISKRPSQKARPQKSYRHISLQDL